MSKKKRKKEFWYRKTEALLYDYEEMAYEIKRLTEELDVGVPPQKPTRVIIFDHNRGTNQSSETEKIAIERVDCRSGRRLMDVKRTYYGLRNARELLNHEESQLVWLKYDKKKRDKDLCPEFNMSERNYFRFKKKVVRKIAKSLGLVPVEKL